MRRTRRRPSTAIHAPAPTTGRHLGPTSLYQPMSEADVDLIIDTSIALLASSGVVFEPGTEADSLLAAAGCSVGEDGIVLIPEAVSRRALETVGKQCQLYDRDGENPVSIDCAHTRFMPGMTCIGVYDESSSEPRASNRDDLARITRLADGLPNIDAVCIGAKNVAESNLYGEVDEFLCLMENTTKPIEYLCEYPVSLDAAIEMASLLRGGGDALRARPYFLHLITPLPVNFAAIHIEQIITAVRAGIPVGVGTLPIGGASSPITLAGCLTHALMTDIAAMVLGQLVEEGSFCIGCSDVNFMEPATGAIGSFSQNSLADMAACQVRHRLGIPPLTGTGGCSVAPTFNQDAVWELSSNMMQMFYNRPATCDYLGSLDQGLTFSEHALLLCDDLAGLLKKMWEGVQVSPEQIGADMIERLGPRGQYLAEPHTVENCRMQVWDSRYLGANFPLSNNDIPQDDLKVRLDADLQTRLAAPGPPPLDPTLRAQAGAVVDRFR